MNHKVYKHKFVVTVLSEDILEGSISLEDLHYNITSGPGLGLMKLASREELTDREQIVQECRLLNNDGGFFTDFWDEENEDAQGE